MATPTASLGTPLHEILDRLAAFQPVDAPVLSLYLDLRPDQHGRDAVDAFLRKSFAERRAVLVGRARASFDVDTERITAFLASRVRTSANGIAVFACSAADRFFETVQLDAPIEHHWLFVAAVPHLYPLALVTDQYPRYAALLVDTHSARLFVFSLGALESRDRIENARTRRTQVGGWSQARYQRHVDNFHLLHMKEVADLLDRVVRDDGITQVVLACDEAARPPLLEHLAPDVADKIVDILHLDIRTPEHAVLASTLEALRGRDAIADADHVRRAIDAWQADGLGVVGPDATRHAFERGQVEELLITATLDHVRTVAPAAGSVISAVDTTARAAAAVPERLDIVNALVASAHRTGSRVRFIEDPALLAEVGGIAALLRFRT